MKTPGRILTIALLFAGISAPLHAAAVRDLVVIDFTDMLRNTDGTRQRSYEYTYGDWNDPTGKSVVQMLGKGLLINFVGSKGGVGANRDLDFRKHTRARINLIIGNRNRAGSFGFSLVDTDGTDQSWDISLKDQPVGRPLNLLVDLTKPSGENKPGRKPGLNLAKLASWQIRGNFQDEPIEILVLKITAVSE